MVLQLYVYIYIYIERERERGREKENERGGEKVIIKAIHERKTLVMKSKSVHMPTRRAI